MKKRKGFTLIEILIMVVILGILAVIITSQFTDFREEIRKAPEPNDVNVIAVEPNIVDANTLPEPNEG